MKMRGAPGTGAEDADRSCGQPRPVKVRHARRHQRGFSGGGRHVQERRRTPGEVEEELAARKSCDGEAPRATLKDLGNSGASSIEVIHAVE